MKDNFTDVEIDQFKDEDVIKGFEEILKNPNNKLSLVEQAVCADVASLINCQKAEIEWLQEYYKMYLDQEIEINDKQIEIDYMQDKYSLLEENIKKLNSKAIKRFAERLKEKLNTLMYTKETDRKTVPADFFVCMMNDILHEAVPCVIDIVLKEMTEEAQK